MLERALDMASNSAWVHAQITRRFIDTETIKLHPTESHSAVRRQFHQRLANRDQILRSTQARSAKLFTGMT